MKWFLLIIRYLPSVLQGVVAVEAAIKETAGSTKKAVVLGILKAGTETAAQFPEEHVQAVGGLIDKVVDTLNAEGVFTSSKDGK